MSARNSFQDHIPELFRVPSLNSHDVFELSISELQSYYKHQAFTVTEYITFCLHHIQRLDCYLEAVIEVNPDALAIAAALDGDAQNCRALGPLHGVPVLVKDNIATKDKMQTTAGTWSLLGSIVPRDAFVVEKLRQAGAIVIGHANMSEMASTRSRYYSDGYSPRRGQCRNPFDLERSPFGSSGGSAVAVSSNFVPVAIGTETDGSIAGPAQINAVVGLKPTPGLVSRAGVIAVSETWDTVGPLARSVLDAALVLDAVAGPDPRDSRTNQCPPECFQGYAAAVTNKDALKGARFGLPINGVWQHVPPSQRRVAEHIFRGIRDCGGEVIEVDYPCAEDRIAVDGGWDWELGEPSKQEYTVVKIEAYNAVNDYLEELEGTSIRTFEDIVEFNEKNKGTEGANPGDHPAFRSGQDVLDEILEAKGIKSDTYYAALKHVQHMTREKGIDAALNHPLPDGRPGQLDALILCDRKLCGQQIAAQAGYPTITIPIGMDDHGMPVGLTLQQTEWQEATLVKWASAIEDMRNAYGESRPVPTYRNYTSKVLPIKGSY